MFFELVTSYSTFSPYLCSVKRQKGALQGAVADKKHKFNPLNTYNYDTYSLSRSNRLT